MIPAKRKSVKEILRVPLYEPEHFTWIREATDDELDEYILGVSGNEAIHRMAVSERQKRHFKHLSNEWLGCRLSLHLLICRSIVLISISFLNH